MDIENLKLVLETLSHMGEQGKEAFIWWVVLDKALWPLVFLICAPIVVLAFRTVHQHEHQLRAIRDMLDVGSRGLFTGSEFREIMATLKKVKGVG